MSGRGMFALPSRLVRAATVAGLAVGIVYALSPLTVWFAIATVLVVGYATSGLDPVERRAVTRMLMAAVTLRLIAVAGLFLLTDHTQVAFGSFFGDEEYFIERSLWLRNAALMAPWHRADLLTVFDGAAASGYVSLLALVQLLVGPAPYGVHLLGILFFLLAVVLLYRLVRSTMGHVPALSGLAVLLFLPSLFAWSVSALKEPLFVLLSALNLVLAATLVRGSSRRTRILALSAIGAFAAALETIRQGGAALSLSSVLIGLTIGFLAARPRLMLATLVAAPIVTGATLSRPDVQLKAYAALRSAASQHWAYVTLSPGYSYKLLDERFYAGPPDLPGVRPGEALRFLVRAPVAWVTVPLPWSARSNAMLAYLPEQIVWYVLAALAPVGLLFAFRRDAMVGGLLLGHAIVIAAAVALTDGNIGTLVRHRGLALPYLVWLSAVGGCEVIAAALRRSPGTLSSSVIAGRTA